MDPEPFPIKPSEFTELFSLQNITTGASQAILRDLGGTIG